MVQSMMTAPEIQPPKFQRGLVVFVALADAQIEACRADISEYADLYDDFRVLATDNPAWLAGQVFDGPIELFRPAPVPLEGDWERWLKLIEIKWRPSIIVNLGHPRFDPTETRSYLPPAPF